MHSVSFPSTQTAAASMRAKVSFCACQRCSRRYQHCKDGACVLGAQSQHTHSVRSAYGHTHAGNLMCLLLLLEEGASGADRLAAASTSLFPTIAAAVLGDCTHALILIVPALQWKKKRMRRLKRKRRRQRSK